jgi:hypothetical protein
MIVAMPRDGAIIFGDPIGKLDVLSVACEAGRYQLQRLIDDRGREAKLIDWLMRSPPTAQRRLRTT